MGGSHGTFACTDPAERTARAPMSKTLSKRLDRLEERLLPDGPPRCWQILYVSHEGRETGPILQWQPGPTGNTHQESSLDGASLEGK